MSKTVVSLFAGGGGKTHGAIAAGYTPIGAVDYNQAACAHYKANIGDIYQESILTLDPIAFDKPDLLMASPPCPSYSRINKDGKETINDWQLAKRVLDYIADLQPKIVLVENVIDYKKSESFKLLIAGLKQYRYNYEILTLNAADFGVPQSRVRLFVRAVKSGQMLPVKPTHQELGYGLPRWKGWYEAIYDLLPTMPVSKLTPAQRAVVKGKTTSQIIQRIGYYSGKPYCWSSERPIGTIRASLADDGKGNNRSKYMDAWIASSGDVRSINTEALVRLQGWPPGLKWSGAAFADVRILGNSVCPAVVTAILKTIT